MVEPYWIMAADLGGALVAGSLIGMERELRAQPAGFRTHALVAFGSGLAMLVPPFVPQWVGTSPEGFYSVDPVKITEGVLAGVGFIGAGVIFKEDFSIRGLTTAASIWVTAAIGMLYGIGHHVPAVGATVLTLLVLSVFNWIERRLPISHIAIHSVRFQPAKAPDPDGYADELRGDGVTATEIATKADREAGITELKMRLRTTDPAAYNALAARLAADPRIAAFEVAPIP